jgi:hypothetical protein
MKCNNKVSQFVPKGYDYKEVKSPCGSTGIHGEQLICEDCKNDPSIVAERRRIQRNADADNAWLASAGWGEM